uniref:WD repeat-containing protein 55 homolog n=1 Tax=Glossina palpalis gambiensis TaxID=67801 RepID=A0A1B0BEQ7_9MUSC
MPFFFNNQKTLSVTLICLELDKDGTLLRFTSPVISIKIKDDYIAACSEDTTIKILEDDATQPKSTMLASFSGDGSVKVWNLQKECKELYSVQALSKTNSFEKTICFDTPCFEPIEVKILMYIKKNEIKAISTANCEHLFSLNDDKVKGEYTDCQFSQNGLLLAAAYCDAYAQLGTVFGSSELQKENGDGDDSELLLNNDFDDIEFTGDTNDDAERL